MIKSAAQSSLLNDTRYTSMSAGIVPSSEYLISTTVLTQNEPSITFDVSAFAGVYKHLQIVYVARTGLSDVGDWLNIRFNGSASAYSAHHLSGNGSNVISGAFTSQSSIYLFRGLTSANGAANAFGCGIIEILDAFNTNKNKTLRSLNGNSGGYNNVTLNSGLWANTNSISSITLTPYTGNSFIPGSRFSIYGVTA